VKEERAQFKVMTIGFVLVMMMMIELVLVMMMIIVIVMINDGGNVDDHEPLLSNTDGTFNVSISHLLGLRLVEQRVLGLEGAGW
jgi:hypothetical protein